MSFPAWGIQQADGTLALRACDTDVPPPFSWDAAEVLLRHNGEGTLYLSRTKLLADLLSRKYCEDNTPVRLRIMTEAEYRELLRHIEEIEK